MSFDPITLAMAKAYTDEKVESGGSGGCSCVTLPVVDLGAIEFGSEPGEDAEVPIELRAQLNAAAATGLPIVLKTSGTSTVVNYVGDRMYLCYDYNTTYWFGVTSTKSGGWWVGYYE